MFKDKKIMIVGMAKSGIASAKYLLNDGAKVILNDMKKEEELSNVIEMFSSYEKFEYIFGRNPESDDIDNVDMIVLSPGVSLDVDFVVDAKEKNKKCISEIELSYLASKNKNIDFIGITGTNGKTTTTSMIGEILKSTEKETYVVGNIGNPAIEAVSDADENSCMVTELSSFQLESVYEFNPKVCTVLNLTPDHLNRHHTMENYARAKMNIFKNQGHEDICVLNYDDEITRKMYKKVKSKIVFFSRLSSREEICKNIENNSELNTITLKNGVVVYEGVDRKDEIMMADELSLPGGHNLENAMAAIGVCLSYGVSKNIIKNVLKTFKAVEHRLEFVDKVNGVSYVNDSKGTNPDSTIKAVTSYKNPIVLIAGGYDKASDFNELFEVAKNNVKAVVSLGQTAEIIKDTSIKHGIKEVYIVSSMQEAVKKSYEISVENDIVLLSPACASWGMYNNYEERGRDFKNCVKSLKKNL